MINKSYKLLVKLIFSLFILTLCASADVQLIKKENNDSNTTLLVIGGIHGNEPGGYFSPAILATHYKITSNNLWIVPNLNKDSIQANQRGIHGDMNRKFAVIKKNDEDAEIVKEIKSIILSKQVSLILNLHDGHGFYRTKNEGSIFNPNAWGQTCVIDQCNLSKNEKFSDLNAIALTVQNNLNKNLLQNHHTFNVRNTNTKFDDEAMQLSLTYFAVTNDKPAFAIESSKNLSSLSKKVFYQLLAIEEFMKIMDISFVRDFDLSEQNVKELIKDYGSLKINNNILLHLSDVKKYLSYIPLNSKDNTFEFSHPLGSVKKVNNTYLVYIGNKQITTLRPQYFKMAKDCDENFDVSIDDKLVSLPSASDFIVNNSFNVSKKKDTRVNVIGYSARGVTNESGIDVNLKNLSHEFSVDNDNKIYRLEFYKNDEFCSMSMVHFK
jgi:hypothetical protein